MIRAAIVVGLAAITACGDNYTLVVDAAPASGSADAAGGPDAAIVRDAATDVAADAPSGGPFDASPGMDAGITLACTVAELQPLFTCALTSCSTTPTLACFTTNCSLLVLTLSPACRTCVLTGLLSQDPMTTAAACGFGSP